MHQKLRKCLYNLIIVIEVYETVDLCTDLIKVQLTYLLKCFLDVYVIFSPI